MTTPPTLIASQWLNRYADQLVGHRTVTEGLQVRNSLKTLLGQVLFHSKGRSQYQSNRGTCLSHLRIDPSVLFESSHHK